MRDKVWYFLVDSKTNEYFSSRIVLKYQKMDFFSNIFLFMATSSSIAAWTIWKQYPFLWSIIIVSSQILTIIKSSFLFPKYIKVFNEKGIKWQSLSLEIEELWHNLNNNLIDDDQVSIKYFALRNKCLLFDNVSDDIIFFDNPKGRLKAQKQCENYLTKI